MSSSRDANKPAVKNLTPFFLKILPVTSYELESQPTVEEMKKAVSAILLQAPSLSNSSLSPPQLVAPMVTPVPKPSLKRPRPKFTQENLSTKLKNILMRDLERTDFDEHNPVELDPSLTDRSQEVILSRINCYLRSRSKPEISEEGFCHGIGVLRMLMQHYGFGLDYKMMVKTITATPLNQLTRIGDLIDDYLILIDIAQNPKKYSNNTCEQKHLRTIIGDTDTLFTFKRKHYKRSLENALKRLLPTEIDSMMTIAGFGIDQKTKKEKGHTVTVYTHAEKNKTTFQFFQANDKAGEEKYLSTIQEVVKHSWNNIFVDDPEGNKEGCLIGGNRPQFIVSAVKPKPKPSWLDSVTSFFSQNKSLVETKVGAPVIEKEKQTSSFSPMGWFGSFSMGSSG